MGKYTNVNVSQLKSTCTNAKREVTSAMTALKNDYNTMKSDSFYGSCIPNLASIFAMVVVNESYLKGNLPKLKKYLGSILDGLEYVEKYQKAEKKYLAAVETKNATAIKNNDTISNSISENTINDSILLSAKSEMDKYERLADQKFKEVN